MESATLEIECFEMELFKCWDSALFFLKEEMDARAVLRKMQNLLKFWLVIYVDSNVDK